MSPRVNEVRYVGRRELLKQLGISKHTLLRWSKSRNFPKPMPGSGQVPIYDAQLVDQWLRSEALLQDTSEATANVDGSGIKAREQESDG